MKPYQIGTSQIDAAHTIWTDQVFRMGTIFILFQYATERDWKKGIGIVANRYSIIDIKGIGYIKHIAIAQALCQDFCATCLTLEQTDKLRIGDCSCKLELRTFFV